MKSPRWTYVSPSDFAWERDALEFLRERLPDYEPWHAWSNLEFIDDEGRVNEVDCLVLMPRGLILIEIKSRPGTLKGDAHTWTWKDNGRLYSSDNPLLLANRKAKRLASLLGRQDAFRRSHTRVLYVDCAIFLSAVSAQPDIDPGSKTKVFLRGDPGKPSDRGIVAALTDQPAGAVIRSPVDSSLARTTRRALEQAGVRPALRSRRVADYELEELLAEGEGWQDFIGKHVSLPNVTRRIRLYPFARAASKVERGRLRRMAEREFRVLEGIEHPGILRVRDYQDTDRGPALIFDHDPAACRLDQLLIQSLASLDLNARLDLLRQLALALGYAHGKHLYHQSLAPQNILVQDPDTRNPRLLIMNWQVAMRGEGSSGISPGMSGTHHLADHLSDPAKLYVAPEILSSGVEGGARADVFSLGAIAYHLFTGQPPADNPLDLPSKLAAGGGLVLSGAIDGVGRDLEDLVRMSTAPDVGQRLKTATEFLEYLALAEADERPAQPVETMVDPSVAQKGDRLDGGLIVDRRLGQGSTADALLVYREDSDIRMVLKVAINATHEERLRAEADVLASLRHTNIVRYIETVTVSGRVGILMEWAGAESLAAIIRGPDRPSLDMVSRYGEELLQAIDYIEQQGVAHRDIKPDNIAIGAAGGTGRKRLVLFDFSLSRTPPENIAAGTRPYLDPFLRLRRPARWDQYAERYAAAMTLHEIVTGTTPAWGDGLSDPAATDGEINLAAERFQPILRPGLLTFFHAALARQPEDRFGNAEDMLRAWRQAFAPLNAALLAPNDLEVTARQLDRRSPTAQVGFSVEAREVLDNMHIHTVEQLLGVERIRFRYLRQVGDRVRKEIRLTAKRLAEYRPDLLPGADDQPGQGRASLDRLNELLLPRRPAGAESNEDRALEAYLGLDGALAWPTVGEVAQTCRLPRSVIADALTQARERWHRARDLNDLRTDLRALLDAMGGVATLEEMTMLLLTTRGTIETDPADRTCIARAVIRASVELEAAAMDDPRFVADTDAAPILIAISTEHAIYARLLGMQADSMAPTTPPPSPAAVDEALDTVARPDSPVQPIGQRRLRLAVATSTSAALSAQSELYPRNLPPIDALTRSLGAISGPQKLTRKDIVTRVTARFPDAAPLPDRPELDTLLDQAGAERVWQDDANGGAYVSRRSSATASSAVALLRHPTNASAIDATPEVLNARSLEEQLVYSNRTGAFLALTVEPRRAMQAEAELLRRYPRVRVSLERLMLQGLRHEAATRRAKWPVVVAADAAAPDSTEFRRLSALASRAADGVRRQVLALDEPALLVNPGLMARYGLMPLLTEFAQASGTRGGPTSLWLLIPQPDDGMPRIDGAGLQVIGAANWAHLSDKWLENAHRAGARPAA